VETVVKLAFHLVHVPTLEAWQLQAPRTLDQVVVVDQVPAQMAAQGW
jgi:hypothetical protein